MNLADSYPWLKALHVAAALAFVGGVLAVSVILQALPADSAGSAPVARIVRRWDRAVTTPAMLLVWALGLTLATASQAFTDGWLQAKLALVLALPGCTASDPGACAGWRAAIRSRRHALRYVIGCRYEGVGEAVRRADAHLQAIKAEIGLSLGRRNLTAALVARLRPPCPASLQDGRVDLLGLRARTTAGGGEAAPDRPRPCTSGERHRPRGRVRRRLLLQSNLQASVRLNPDGAPQQAGMICDQSARRAPGALRDRSRH